MPIGICQSTIIQCTDRHNKECILPWEYENDDQVADGGEEHQYRHHIPVHWLDEVEWTQEGARIDHIAGRGENTTEMEIILCVSKIISLIEALTL